MTVLLAYLPVDFETNTRNNFRAVPTGIASLAGMVRSREPAVLDAIALQLDQERTIAAVTRFNPDVLGLSVSTPQLESSLELARYWKAKRPEARIVLGGAHVSALPGDTMRRDDSVDFEIYGEGELTFKELLARLDSGESLDTVKGLAFRRDGEVTVNPPREFIDDLDALPMPAYDLLPMDRYAIPQQKRTPFCSIITSRGCPYNCIYCSVKCIHGRRYRTKSPESVVAEMEHLHRRYGIREIMIKDSIFTVDRRRVKQICDAIREKRLDIVWSCNSRVDLNESEVLASLKSAGCWLVQYGVESGDEGILAAARRKMKRNDIKAAFELSHAAGLDTHAFFIIGLPGETPRTCDATIEFARDLNPTYAGFSIAIPYPGTQLYQWAKENATYLESDWKQFKMDRAVFETPQFSRADMTAYQKKAYLRFYLNPRNIAKRLRRINRSDLRNLMIFLKVFLPVRKKAELY
jgi:radical SAM superfamily enzyme YgiQ (UPF0313 family)